MNKKIKIMSVVLAILILLFTINTKVFALTEIIEDGQDFLAQADKGAANISVGKLQEVSGYLYNILLAAGVIIAVIVATALGLQFMLAGAEGQAKVKEMILPFVIGCIVVFGGFGFWKIALTIGKNIESTRIEDTSTSEESGCTHGTTTIITIGNTRMCEECRYEFAHDYDIEICSKCGKRICPDCRAIIEE